MSTASASREVKFQKKSGTFMVTIVSSQGDLWQEYTGEANSAATIKPDWTNADTKPSLELLVVSSRVSEGAVSSDKIAISWYFNDTEITWNTSASSDGYVYSSGTFANYFRKEVSSTGRHTLRIMKNLAALAGYASCIIKAQALVLLNNYTDTLQGTYTIPIQQSSGNSWKVTIAPGDAKNFTLTSGTDSCILKAVTYFDGSEQSITSNFTYKWYKLSGTTWTQLSSTGSSITVQAANVDTYAQYKVEVFDATGGNQRGSDVQGVTDTSDPYLVQPNPTPTDETISETTDSSGTIVYTPKVVKRSTNTAIASQPKWDFQAMDSVGGYAGSASNVDSFTVKEEWCANKGGNLTIIMTSKDFTE